MGKILCVFGDSATWGAWDMERGGWLKRLWLFTAQKNSKLQGKLIKFYDLSITAETTETILAHFEFEAKTRKADVLIFQAGKNDMAYKYTEDNYFVPPEKVRTNLDEIIGKAGKITRNIIFIGPANVDETKTMPWGPLGNLYYANANIKKCNEIIKDVCAKNNIPFLNIFGILRDEDLSDGLHPNASGHQKIFEEVKNFLLERKMI
jgi:lysophospholipase L1-like esterase